MSVNLPLLLHAPLIIQFHLLVAFIAIAGGAAQFMLKKGTSTHKIIGRLWVLAMGLVAVSGLFIHEIRMFGGFNPIHFLSLLTLFFLYMGVRAARKKQIGRHQRIMIYTYFLGLIVTGFFTLWPGRLMHHILPAGASQ
jgi:uncharacterized membrane protein